MPTAIHWARYAFGWTPGAAKVMARVMAESETGAAITNLRATGIPAPQTVNITVIDPEARVTVTRDWFESRSRNSAFAGARLLGKASEVLVGGRFALRHGKVVE